MNYNDLFYKKIIKQILALYLQRIIDLQQHLILEQTFGDAMNKCDCVLLLFPVLSIHTNICRRHNFPEAVFLLSQSNVIHCEIVMVLFFTCLSEQSKQRTANIIAHRKDLDLYIKTSS